MSVTEAEAKVIKWFPDNYQDLEVTGAVYFDLNDIISVGKSEQWYLGRVSYPEKTAKGKIKMKSFQVMVNGTSLKDGLKNMEEAFKDGVMDYSMAKIEETKTILDDDLVEI